MSRLAAVRLPAVPGPGWRAELRELDVLAASSSSLALPEARVTDVAGGDVLGSDPADDRPLVFDPAAGGGPLAGPEAQRSAAAFGLVNVAYHVQRGLRHLGGLLGRPLPPLEVCIGMHPHGPRGWGGGHYRLPARSYSELSETEPVTATGEIHLGRGRAFLTTGEGRYFHAPAHNVAFVYHELGHHLCRHTADFRLNAMREPQAQANHKTAVDEGTCDYLAAVLLGTPDIYGWHRGELSEEDQRRRRLDPRWTMAAFRGGHTTDPHADGTIWASALWSARTAVAGASVEPQVFDGMLVRALDVLGNQPAELCEEELRSRRQFGRVLEALLTVAETESVQEVVEEAFAMHGIHVGLSNAALRDGSRGSFAAAS